MSICNALKQQLEGNDFNLQELKVKSLLHVIIAMGLKGDYHMHTHIHRLTFTINNSYQ